jgi:thimet oligopeptidase
MRFVYGFLIFIGVLMVSSAVLFFLFLLFNVGSVMSLQSLKCKYDISSVFVKNEEEVDIRKNDAINAIKKLKAKILSASEDSFDNTFGLLDEICFISSLFGGMAEGYMLIGKSIEVKNKLNMATQELSEWLSVEVSCNSGIYNILQKVYSNLSDDSDLNPDQIKLMKDTIKEMSLSGASLNEEDKNKLIGLRKNLMQVQFEFDQNIQNDKKGIWVSNDELYGLPYGFIKSLKAEDGKFFLGTDYPTYEMVMSYCSCRETRKKLYYEFVNVAYPKNLELIKKIREIRKQIASLFGYEKFADYDLQLTMAKNVDNVLSLLDKVYDISKEHAIEEKREIECFVKEYMADEIVDGINVWDMSYISTRLKKVKYDVDKNEIAEYFPVQQTISRLLDVYSHFFDLVMIKREDKSSIDDQYRNYIDIVDIYDSKKSFIGTILLDLYPRDGKYTHACMSSLIHSVKDKNGRLLLGGPICFVVCNFSKPTEDRDGLLKHREVETFFHEFGHALHDLFGATNYASQSGTNVAVDFVETPSQLLEEWMWEPEILKIVSGHYKTGEAMPDLMINKMLKCKKLGIGGMYQGQWSNSMLSLDMYRRDNDLIDLKYEFEDKIVKISQQKHDSNSHFECRFGHISSSLYASKYYSYIWSLVNSLDIFSVIKENNAFIDPVFGRKLYECILSKGSSEEYDVMLESFLGRKSSTDAFYDYLN